MASVVYAYVYCGIRPGEKSRQGHTTKTGAKQINL